MAVAPVPLLVLLPREFSGRLDYAFAPFAVIAALLIGRAVAPNDCDLAGTSDGWPCHCVAGRVDPAGGDRAGLGVGRRHGAARYRGSGGLGNGRMAGHAGCDPLSASARLVRAVAARSRPLRGPGYGAMVGPISQPFARPARRGPCPRGPSSGLHGWTLGSVRPARGTFFPVRFGGPLARAGPGRRP